MLSVMLPDSSEMRFIWEVLGLLMGINHFFFRKEFRSHFTQSVPFFFEFFSSFWSCGINVEYKWLILVTVDE
jgi:uncharacterized membrane protein